MWCTALVLSLTLWIHAGIPIVLSTVTLKSCTAAIERPSQFGASIDQNVDQIVMGGVKALGMCAGGSLLSDAVLDSGVVSPPFEIPRRVEPWLSEVLLTLGIDELISDYELG
jgi:hypothetical protein